MLQERFFQECEQFTDFTQGFDLVFAQRKRHSMRCPKQVGQQWQLTVTRLFEQQCRALPAQHAITDFGDFEVWINPLCNTFQLASALELCDEVSQIPVFHLPDLDAVKAVPNPGLDYFLGDEKAYQHDADEDQHDNFPVGEKSFPQNNAGRSSIFHSQLRFLVARVDFAL